MATAESRTRPQEDKTPAEIWEGLSEAMRTTLERSEIVARDREYIGGGRWRDKAGSPKIRLATGAHSTLRALQRRGLVCRVERLGASGDANASAKCLLTATGLLVLGRAVAEYRRKAGA